MNDWVVETPSFEEDLMNNRVVMLNQNGVNRVVEIIKKKDKEIERLNNIIEEYKNANEYHQNIIHELETMKQPNQLHSENVKLRAENKRLNNIIKEVREYIGERFTIENGDYYLTHTFSKDNVKELYDILRGDKE